MITINDYLELGWKETNYPSKFITTLEYDAGWGIVAAGIRTETPGTVSLSWNKDYSKEDYTGKDLVRNRNYVNFQLDSKEDLNTIMRLMSMFNNEPK